MNKHITICLLAGAAIALTACGEQQQSRSTSSASESKPAPAAAPQSKETLKPETTASVAPAGEPVAVTPTSAVAIMVPTEGSSVRGQINFQEVPDGVNVTGEITGLTPGEHGFHVHENGDCSSLDGKSAGGHFNPGGEEHGAPTGAMHHAGDMGNITANEQGIAEVAEQFPFLKMDGSNASIMGKAVIVHGVADDLKSQPSGAAGPRMACGVIKAQGATGINTPQS